MKKETDNLKDVAKPNRQEQLLETKNQLNKIKPNKQDSAVEVAKTRSVKDMVLWLVAIVALICVTFVNTWLPGVWLPANDIWVRIGIIAGLVVLALACLAFTNQGAAFKVLLNDASIELRRVTWPTKNETFQFTWQTLLVISIVGFIIWLLDNFFNKVVGFIIG